MEKSHHNRSCPGPAGREGKTSANERKHVGKDGGKHNERCLRMLRVRLYGVKAHAVCLNA